VHRNHVEAARVLLSHQADLTAQSSEDCADLVACNGGSTPLHVAAAGNHVEAARLLLEWHVKVGWRAECLKERVRG
jgi:hypothetical protein